jgi:hypothetical protein
LLTLADMMSRLRLILRASTVILAVSGCGPATGPEQTQTPTAPPANADFDSVTSTPAASCVGGWMISLVPRRGSDPQWAVAPDGSMHIMYIGYGENQMALRHVAEELPGHAETVSTLGLGSLAIAPDGSAHAFLAARSGMLESPERVGIVHVAHAHAGWQIDPAPVSSDGGMFNVSAIDSSGHAHVAFSDTTLYYADNTSGQWVKTGIGTQTQVTVFGLALDRNGNVHIWFSGIDPGSSDVTNHWATNLGGSWNVVAMPSSDVAPAIDSSGVPHVIVDDEATGGLAHLWRVGDRWQSEALPALGSNGSVFDLRIDANDKLHVLFETSAGNILYASNASGTWTVEPIVAVDKLGLVPAGRIGLDRNGQPHIAFKGPVSGASFGFAKRCK